MEDERRMVEFRDGKKLIPGYLADMMSGLQTHTLTYEEAVAKANWQLGQGHVDRAYDGLVQSHFRTGRR